METPQDALNRAQTSEGVRLVIGGFLTLCSLWMAHRALGRSLLRRDQLCVFALPEVLPASLQDQNDAVAPDGPQVRWCEGLRLRVYSPDIFDAVGLSAGDARADGPGWLPKAQADILWDHIRGRMAVLMVETSTPEQQVTCSRIQLQHQPRFVHTFNFSRSGQA